MTKHTPEPWTLQGYHGHLKILGPDLTIDRVDKKGYADAYLIAAAPDLLAACKKARWLLDGQRDDDSVETHDIVCAAIQKAEGR